MGVRRGVGGLGVALRRRAAVAVWLALGLLALGLSIEVRAREALRALDYHATVLNGGIVGSAFAIAEDLAVTNRHVVRGLRPGATVSLATSGDLRVRLTAWLLAVSPNMDLALLRIPAHSLPMVGGQDAQGAAGVGVVAAGIDASRDEPGPRMQLNGSILVPRADLPAFGPGLIAHLPGVRPGFSGGPMLDGQRRLVGMVTAIRPGSRRGGTAASGFAPGRARAADEAYVLRAPAIRAEVARLRAAIGH